MLRAMVGSVFTLLVLTVHAAPGLQDPEPIGPYLNGAFPAVAPGEVVAGSGAWTQRDYFPGVSFIEPIRVVEIPGRNELVVVGKDALGHVITNREGATDKRLYFDLRPIVHGNPESGEGGISDIVFHPSFGGAGQGADKVYISYWWSPDNSGTFSNDRGVDGYNRVSRFAVRNERVDLASELVMINQYDREYWHIGMDMEFGPDGFLYIAAGDETPTTCCDRGDSTQRLDGGLWSGVLRIDVDNDPAKSHPIRRQPRHPTADPRDNGSNWPLSSTQGYSIPNDNPFVKADGSRLEEFYSLGLRHPWTMNIDEPTGDIWVADVGRFSREEINRVRKGDNNQWPFKEGLLDGPDSAPGSVIGTSRAPVWDYTHEVGESVIMAGRYRGRRHPELVGKVLFSDFLEGQLWTATPDGDGYDVERIGSVSAGWTNGISSYLFDTKGQILMVRSKGALRDGGRIDILGRENGGNTTSPAPTLLSQTGAFSDLASRTPIDGCIPYEENVPFWSDAATKSRWMCIPNDGRHDSAAERIVYSEEGAWTFPVGTVFIKHFDIEASEGNAGSAFPLETRFFVVGTEGYYGLSYRWNANGTDATLVDAGGATRGYRQESVTGASVNRTWQYPSRGQCQECHTEAAGSALGVNTRQLNGNHTYAKSGRSANQIETLAHLGLFGGAGDRIIDSLPSVLTASAADDFSASLEDRARSYIDANCGYCHLPGGVRSRWDGRLSTPLADQGLINGELIESAGIAGEAVIVPGDTAKSIAHLRAATLGSRAMPPLAKNRVDEAGVALLGEWIASMSGGGEAPTPVPNPDTNPDASPVPSPDPDATTGGDTGTPENPFVVTDGGATGDGDAAPVGVVNDPASRGGGGSSGGGSASLWFLTMIACVLAARRRRGVGPRIATS